jgi:hypothetical protein
MSVRKKVSVRLGAHVVDIPGEDVHARTTFARTLIELPVLSLMKSGNIGFRMIVIVSRFPYSLRYETPQ